MKLPIGIDDFKELIEDKYDFVDKSLFIKEVIEDGAKVLLITRPRRFGKTINMSMLEYFLSLNKKHEYNLFKNLKISQDTDLCQQHQNQYPVIFITFKNISVDNYEDAENLIKNVISKIYREHEKYVYNSLSDFEKKLYNKILNKTQEKSEFYASLEELTGFYKKATGKKAILIIDEYDSPIHSGYLHNYYDKIVSLMRGIFGSALKGNNSLQKGIVTGITKISSESLFSGVNNFDSYSVLDDFCAEYFGFLEGEVENLVNKSEHKLNMSDIKAWYNGYTIGGFELYNPWSILKCLKNKGALSPYWVNTSENLLLKKLLNNSKFEIKSCFDSLLQDEMLEISVEENLVFPDLQTKESAVWALLLYSGYLKISKKNREYAELIGTMAIPNQEVKEIYEISFKSWFLNSENFSSQKYKNFINSLRNRNFKLFEEFLRTYISETGSYFDFNKNTKEQVFHSFILGLVVGLKDEYKIKSNQESGYGRFDVAFIPKDNKKIPSGIIFEFKVSGNLEDLENKAKEGLSQVIDKKYTNIFKENGTNKVYALGIAFCGKDVKLVSKILEL